MKIVDFDFTRINGQPFDEGKCFSDNDPRHKTKLVITVEHGGYTHKFTAENPQHEITDYSAELRFEGQGWRNQEAAG